MPLGTRAGGAIPGPTLEPPQTAAVVTPDGCARGAAAAALPREPHTKANATSSALTIRKTLQSRRWLRDERRDADEAGRSPARALSATIRPPPDGGRRSSTRSRWPRYRDRPTLIPSRQRARAPRSSTAPPRRHARTRRALDRGLSPGRGRRTSSARAGVA